MNRIWVAGALFAAASCCSSPSTSPGTNSCSRGRVFVIVRHAEKASDTEKDPSLSDRGHARAAAIARMLRTAGVTRLVSSPYKRTQETLAPLAERLGLSIETRPPDKSLGPELERSPDGAVVVVATHSNVLPRLVKELGHATLRGVEGDTLREDDYSRVVLITEPCAGAPIVTELDSDVAP